MKRMRARQGGGLRPREARMTRHVLSSENKRLAGRPHPRIQGLRQEKERSGSELSTQHAPETNLPGLPDPYGPRRVGYGREVASPETRAKSEGPKQPGRGTGRALLGGDSSRTFCVSSAHKGPCPSHTSSPAIRLSALEHRP